MIRTEHAHLTVKAITHPGMTGKNNEDRFAVSAYRLSSHDPTPVLLAVLSDGIGGHRAGEVAAEIVVEAISRKVAESDGHHPTQILSTAVTEASQLVYAYAKNNGSYQGMGATCACALVIGTRLYLTSIGDSRIYLIRGGKIYRLTTDHTWIQEALDKGTIKPEEIRGHPNAHVIRRFVGSPTPPEIDLRLRLNPDENDLQAEANQGLRLRKGDYLLLCSDGLTDLVPDQELLETFGAYPLEEVVQRLVDQACERGGHDNITMIGIEAPENFKAKAKPKKKNNSLNCWLIGCSSLILVLMLLGAVFFAWSGWINRDNSDKSATLQATGTIPSALQTRPAGTSEPENGEESETPLIMSTPSPFPTQGPTYTPWPTSTRIPQSELSLTPSQ